MNKKLLQARQEALQEIAAKHGGVLRPVDVVDTARDPKHVLHGIFEWDDSKAAHQHRLYQARDLIASVQYVYKVEQHTYRAPQWVHDPRLTDKQGYVSLGKLRSDKDLAREAMTEEFQRAGAHLSRAHDLARVLKFKPAEIKRLSDRVERLAAESINQGNG